MSDFIHFAGMMTNTRRKHLILAVLSSPPPPFSDDIEKVKIEVLDDGDSDDVAVGDVQAV